jgi:hypothetical protein
MNAGFIKRSPVPFSSHMKKSKNRQLVIPSDVASDNNINNHIFTPRISDNVMSKSILHYSPHTSGTTIQSSHGQQYHYYPHSTYPNYYAIK